MTTRSIPPAPFGRDDRPLRHGIVNAVLFLLLSPLLLLGLVVMFVVLVARELGR